MHTYIHTYTHTHIERERERERESLYRAMNCSKVVCSGSSFSTSAFVFSSRSGLAGLNVDHRTCKRGGVKPSKPGEWKCAAE